MFPAKTGEATLQCPLQTVTMFLSGTKPQAHSLRPPQPGESGSFSLPATVPGRQGWCVKKREPLFWRSCGVPFPAAHSHPKRLSNFAPPPSARSGAALGMVCELGVRGRRAAARCPSLLLAPALSPSPVSSAAQAPAVAHRDTASRGAPTRPQKASKPENKLS